MIFCDPHFDDTMNRHEKYMHQNIQREELMRDTHKIYIFFFVCFYNTRKTTKDNSKILVYKI